VRVAIYARVSTDEQTVSQQLDALRGDCQRHGWTIADRFTGANLNVKRAEILDGLAKYLGVIRPIGVFGALFVDGSFTTNKAIPGDVDVVLEAPLPVPGLLPIFQRPELNPAHVKATYNVHVCFAFPNHPSSVDLFQQLRTADQAKLKLAPTYRKGILRLPVWP